MGERKKGEREKERREKREKKKMRAEEKRESGMMSDQRVHFIVDNFQCGNERNFLLRKKEKQMREKNEREERIRVS